MTAPAMVVPHTLDAAEKQKVGYCIPDWLRVEQIKVNLANCAGRLMANHPKRSEPIALVNFGPSLVETWEQIRDFTYVFSCSGSHKFLVEHGITPTWHADVDPRAHKVGLMGAPCAETEYLIAATCHPDLFRHLQGFNVKLWHIFDASEEGFRTWPHGEWAVTGGCSVGVRLLTLARVLGFTDLHVFGMDGCARDGASHALAHPNAPRKYASCIVNGRTFDTTPSMLEAARQTFHELDQLVDVAPTFHGDGLVQEMAKSYVRKPPMGDALIAFEKPVTITPEYVDLNRRLHAENLAYGVGGGRYAPIVLQLVEKLHTRSVLDYGCGKGYLAKELPFPIWEYDPAIPEKAKSPRPADLVICTDVLEHVEPGQLRAVLHDLKRVVIKAGYFVIHTGPSTKSLADGRNAHLIQRDKAWWRHKFKKVFVVDAGKEQGPLVHFIVVPRPKSPPSSPTPESTP